MILMRAAYYKKLGPAREVLSVNDLPKPEPGSGEVLVKLSFSGLNPSDCKVRMGFPGATLPFPKVIPGGDGAGEIEAVGPGVNRKPGERVWVTNAQWQRPFGTSAEYVALPEHMVASLPNSVSFEQGATLGVPARAAHYALFSDGPIRGKTVLIAGGAGATSSMAIQLALWAGAKVITTVNTQEKETLVRELGCTHVINYRTEDVEKRITEFTAGEGVDRVIEVNLAANVDLDSKILKQRGTLVAFGSDADLNPKIPFLSLLFKEATLKFFAVYAIEQHHHEQAVKDINQALRDGALHSKIDRVFSLNDVVLAHERQESGQVIGNVVIKV